MLVWLFVLFHCGSPFIWLVSTWDINISFEWFCTDNYYSVNKFLYISDWNWTIVSLQLRFFVQCKYFRSMHQITAVTAATKLRRKHFLLVLFVDDVLKKNRHVLSFQHICGFNNRNIWPFEWRNSHFNDFIFVWGMKRISKHNQFFALWTIGEREKKPNTRTLSTEMKWVIYFYSIGNKRVEKKKRRERLNICMWYIVASSIKKLVKHI